MPKNIFKPLSLVLASLLWPALIPAGAARAQSLIEVAERQLAAGLTEDARTLVGQVLGSENEADREKAGYLAAVLETSGDSAKAGLEGFLKSSVSPERRAQVLERLGDLAFAQGKYLEAEHSWQKAFRAESDPARSQGRLVKIARARLRLERPDSALAALGFALQLGESPATGPIRYWRGEVFRTRGDARNAAGEYSSSYTRPAQPYGLLALYQLQELYGGGTSSSAAQWRKLWSDSRRETIFGEQYFRSSVPSAGFVIQLGAFSTEARARKLAGSLHGLGLEPVIRSGADKLYRVRIESIPSRKEAESIISRLKAKHIECQLILP